MSIDNWKRECELAFSSSKVGKTTYFHFTPHVNSRSQNLSRTTAFHLRPCLLNHSLIRYPVRGNELCLMKIQDSEGGNHHCKFRDYLNLASFNNFE